jgi:YidC/Oxa1 family membrane protein insertase
MPSFLGAETGWFGPWFNLLPVFTVVLFIIQQKMFTPPAIDEQQAAQQKIMNFMMVIMAVMFFKVPAGLCLYFITTSIWGILERKLLPKPQLSEGKIAEIKGASSSELATPTPAKVGGGLMDKLRDAIEQRKKPEAPVDPEELRRLDRERKKRLRDRDS